MMRVAVPTLWSIYIQQSEQSSSIYERDPPASVLDSEQLCTVVSYNDAVVVVERLKSRE